MNDFDFEDREAMLRRRQVRDAALRHRLEERIVLGLPIDADPPETRHKAVAVGSLMGGLIEQMLAVKEPFWDEVRQQWPLLFPACAAKPGRYEKGRLFLYVRSSAALFAFRPRLRAVKAKLATLQTAPKTFSIHLEIHTCPNANNRLK